MKAKKSKKSKATAKRSGTKACSPFTILAGKKPDSDGPWRPGEGWGRSSTGDEQWIKAGKPPKIMR